MFNLKVHLNVLGIYLVVKFLNTLIRTVNIINDYNESRTRMKEYITRNIQLVLKCILKEVLTTDLLK